MWSGHERRKLQILRESGSSALLSSRVTFEQPAWLWLLSLSPLVVWIGLRSFVQMTLVRRMSAIAARLALLVLISLMLAGASRVRITDQLAVIFAVDVSGSIRHFAVDRDATPPARAIDDIQDYLRRAASARGPDDLLGIVAFADQARVAMIPSRGAIDALNLDAPVGDGTDVASAIRLAIAASPPDAAVRLVLASDGNQTSGSAIEAAREAGAMRTGGANRGVRIDVLPIAYSVREEVMIDFVDAPPRAAPAAPVTIRVGLLASAPTRGRLSILRDGEPIDIAPDDPAIGRVIDVPAGRSVHVIEAPLGSGVLHRFRAVFEPEFDERTTVPRGDTYADNNHAEAFTITPARGSVLILTGDEAGSEVLADVLARGGIDATIAPPGAAPDDALEFYRHDLIILQNVPAEVIDERRQELLAAYVRDMGGGLVMIGGPDSFAAGGWTGTPLADILPVQLELPARLLVPEVAIMLVLDNSGSMARSIMGSTRTQQRIANDSAALAIERLDKRDLVGVISFNDDFRVVAPLAPNESPQATARRVRSIASGGGTLIGPPLERAADELLKVTAKAKHIILLTDGESDDRDRLRTLATRISERGITLSTIAVGDEADGATLQAIAELGGGTYYEVLNPAVLPQVFLKAVRIVRSPMILHERFEPVILPAPSPLTLNLPQPPSLLALNMTEPRDDPRVTNAMAGPRGLPLLAHWNVGLGKVAAFTSDAHQWAAEWLEWPGYEQFWTQTVRAMSRSASDRATELFVSARDGSLSIRLDAVDAGNRPIDGLRAPVAVYRPGGEKVEIDLTQTAPGVYEATVPADEAGTYVAVANPALGETRLSPAIAGASIASGVEFRRLSSNTDLLREIARTTGGRVLGFNDDPAALFDRSGMRPVRARTPMWPTLLVWTIVVALLDIGTRRVAWDRYFGPEFGAAARRQLAAADRIRGRAAAAVTGILTTRARAVGESRASDTALSDRDAEEIARAESRRRLEARLAAARAARGRDLQSSPEPTVTPDEPPEASRQGDGPSSLIAAKKRARERFDQDEPA